jgi:hypothetical protein
MAGLGLVGGLTVEKLFLAILLPLSAALILGVRQFAEQTEAANRLDKLKDHAERLSSDSCDGAARARLTSRSRVLQDEIFENRKRSPLVFDWIFRKLRNDYNAQVIMGRRRLPRRQNGDWGSQVNWSESQSGASASLQQNSARSPGG